MKNRLCTFLREFVKEEFVQNGFSISSKFGTYFFFLTLKVIASSTQFFAIFENLYTKIIERLDVNPNFKKKNEDHRVNFDILF